MISQIVVKIVLAQLLAIACLAQYATDNNYTIVTGMWNLGRGDFATSARGYQKYYLSFFRELLQYDGPMVIFGSDLEYEYTLRYRPKAQIQNNTLFIRKQLKDFQKYWYTQKIWKVIETKISSQTPLQKFLKSSTPQFGLKMYNPVVMSKHRLIMQAAEINRFNTDYHLWADGGIIHIIPSDFFEDNFFNKIFQYYQPTWIIQAGVKWNFKSLSTGFKDEGSEYILPNTQPSTHVLGNWVGGRTIAASTAYHIYENLLRITLEKNDMNTDESVFILMAERYYYFFQKLENANMQKHLGIVQLTMNNTSNIQLPDRLFKWNQTEISADMIQITQDYGPFIVPEIIQLNEHQYFQKGKQLFKRTLYKRIAFLVLLIIIFISVRIFLS